MKNKQSSFTKIGLFTKPDDPLVAKTCACVASYLVKNNYEVFVDEDSAKNLAKEEKKILNQITIKNKNEIGEDCNLIIVTGGDGSLLNTARITVDQNVPLLGINTGKLGFLADICPKSLDSMLKPIMEGEYQQEERTLLNATVLRNNKEIFTCTALNDVVMNSASIARMIEFKIYIDDQFVLKQRSDGIITSTPTGSTAYSLSGGGPILYPTLNAFCLVPMFPHTLSNRPIIIKDSSKIKIIISEEKLILNLSFDGQEHIPLKHNDEIILKKHKNTIKLLHPKGYNYYDVLREKLGWNVSKTSNSCKISSMHI